MIGHFPSAYPDELLYSICARFSDRVQYTESQGVLKDLFGTKTAVAVVDLPGRLNSLVSRLPPGFSCTVDDLIDNHTLLPYYAPFVTPERLQRVRETMANESGGQRIHARLGVAFGPIPRPQWLQFCPLCAQEERELLGECYWHRLHQAPGVEVCPTHRTWLERSDVRTRNRLGPGVFYSAQRTIQAECPRALEISHPWQQTLMAIANDIEWLLMQRGLVVGPEVLHKLYTVGLIRCRLASQCGIVHVQDLLQKCREYYPPDFLERMHCGLDEDRARLWPYHVVRSRSAAVPPIYHLLMIRVLGHTMESFLALPKEYLPYGESPWPCLNPVCSQYLQPVIPECRWTGRLRHGVSHTRGVFTCPYCGFTYTRTGPDQLPEDRFQWSCVGEAFGPVWEAALKMLWEKPDTSLKQIARHLGVTESKVKQQAMRLGLSPLRPGSQPLVFHSQGPSKHQRKKLPTAAELEAHRREWVGILEARPEANLKKLQKEFPQVYFWLLGNDTNWLNSHKPKRRDPYSPSSYADWKKRDEELAEEARMIAARVKGTPGRPKRITRWAIGRETGKTRWIWRYLDRLPLTAQVLAEVVESRQTCAIRKISWAVEQYCEERVVPKRWQLILRAGFSKRDYTDPQISSAIDAAMRTLERNAAGDWAETGAGGQESGGE